MPTAACLPARQNGLFEIGRFCFVPRKSAHPLISLDKDYLGSDKQQRSKGMLMKFTQKILSVCVATLMASSAFALTPAEKNAEKTRIEAEYKAAKQQCKSMKGNAKDVCEKQASGHEKVAKAELNFRADGSETNRHKLAKAKADADYDVAKEKCDDLSGNTKDVCVKDAKAAHVKALEAAKVAEARMETNTNAASKKADVADARQEAAEKVRDAEYQAAKERCDAMSGNAKDACVADAKRKFAQ